MADRQLNVLIWMAHHLEASDIIAGYVERVRKVFEGHCVRVVQSADAQPEGLEDVEVLVTWGVRPDALQKMKKLEWIQFGSAGINHALTPELLATKIRLTTQKGVFAVPIAEHVMAMILSLCRRLDFFARSQGEHRWTREAPGRRIREFQNATVGIVGMGHIGREVARRCRALGARTVATRSRSASEDEADLWVERSDIGPLLLESDFTVLCVPQTPESQCLIGPSALAQMKPGSVLVNISRGSVVDQSALLEALASGHLGGACLDVFEQEPLAPDSPLWDMPQVIITPHVSGTTPHYGERGAANVAANLNAFLSGQEMPTEYLRSRGY
ncbi:MAG: D-2-hydroxyacid dehydrogenase [Armatimonadetes bacterium]|nr:D-2-hydroxyacid dehydrogenase [Armatimonadota bacterium]